MSSPDLRRLDPAQLAQLYQQLRSGGPPPEPPLTATGRQQWPLSFPQEQLWFLEQAIPGNSAYHVMEAIRIDGPLLVAPLESALRQLLERQGALRTVFHIDPDGRPGQRLAPLAGWQLPVRELAGLPEPQQRERLHQLMAEQAERPFDLTTGPLFRSLLCRLAADSHVLILTMHHLVIDGWSFAVLLDELATLYQAARTGHPPALPPLPPLPIVYGDFAAWQRDRLQGTRLDRLLGYWRAALAGAPAGVELPKTGQDSGTPGGAHRSFSVPTPIAAALRRLPRAAGTTMFVTLLAAFLLVLRHRSGNDDLVIGTDVANRTRPETQRLVGLFVNQLVLRANCAGNPSFREWSGRVRQTLVDAFTHQELPFGTLVAQLAPPNRRPERNPLFNVLFVLQDAALPRWQVPGLTVTAETLHAPSTGSPFDLGVHVSEPGAGIEAVVRYRPDRFGASLVDELISDYLAVLRAIAAGGAEQPVDAIAGLLAAAHEHRQVSTRDTVRSAGQRTVRTGHRRPAAQSDPRD